MRVLKYAMFVIVTLQVIGCSEGEEFENNESPTVETNEQTETNTPGNEEAEIPELTVPTVEIPPLRWSLVGIGDGVDVVEIEATEPDPTWISNDLLTNTLFSVSNTVAAKINCFSYQFEYEATSLTTFRLGLSEPLGLDPDCVPTAPEGVVDSVIGEFENITTGIDDQNRLTITDGTQITLVFSLLADE